MTVSTFSHGNRTTTGVQYNSQSIPVMVDTVTFTQFLTGLTTYFY